MARKKALKRKDIERLEATSSLSVTTITQNQNGNTEPETSMNNDGCTNAHDTCDAAMML